MIKQIFQFIFVFSFSTSVGLSQYQESRRPVTIRAVEGLQFDPPRAKMDLGQTVRFRFLNRDPNDQPHNLVLIKPGSLQEIQKASMVIDSKSIERGYLPEHEAVLLATKLLTADQGEDLLFTPKEAGVYHYVCTYPGHANIMYGALYVGKKFGSLEDDQNVPQIARDRAKRIEEAQKVITRPMVKRFFVEKVGPAAIAVALPGDLNYCWDAGNCRLRSAWSGEFLNLGRTSRSNGNFQARIEGEEFWNGGGDETTYTMQIGDSKLKPDFKGYRLIDGKPEFRYLMGKLEVREFLTETSEGLSHQIKINNAREPVRIYTKGEVAHNVGKREGDYLIVAPKDASNVQLTILTK